MKKISLLILTSLIILSACDKKDDPAPEDKTYGNNVVTAIVTDKDNVKWIGTNDGLFQISGDILTSVNVSGSSHIQTLLYEKSTNILWIGTSNGLLKSTINGTTLTDIVNIDADKLSSSNILSGYTESGQYKWFGTETGLSFNKESVWQNDSFRINITSGRIFPIPVAEDVSINSIASWDGDYYFATSGASVFRAKTFVDSVDAFTGASQWISPYNGQNITDTMYVVFVDSKGNQWMGGKNGVQYHTGHDDKDGSSYTSYKTELADTIIHSIGEAPDGKIWIGTEKGLSILNGSNWSEYVDKLPDPFVTAIAFDKDGSAWIGTKKGIRHIY